MNAVTFRFLVAAAFAGLAGMALGIAMGIKQDVRLAHIHAHVNLLGWVTLALYGLFYQIVPEASVGLLPRLHFWVASLGPLLMCVGLAAHMLDYPHMMPLTSVGAIMTLGGMVLFRAALLRLKAGMRGRANAPALARP